MTYYEGVTLSERLKTAPLPALELFRIGISVAQGLKCAHDNGIIHRDIKPGNILITEDGYVKILDFGLAKLAGIAGVTKTGVTLGTVRYMSPELGAGKDADSRSDIWSLGLLMYELATGVFPFKGDFDPAVIYSILNTQPLPAHEVNPDIPESHSRVIAKCLEKDPDQRYQTVAELINDMGGAAQEEGWGSSFGDLVLPVSKSGFGSIPARRRVWRRTLLAAGFLAVVLTAVVWWMSGPPAQYTTDLRVAVMPLKNKAHPSQETLTKGMWDVVGQMVDHASRLHDSMWMVPNRLVRYAEIGEDAQAKNTFGVNRIVTGGIQRFEGGQVLLLVLRDAESLVQIRTVRVPFDPLTNALADSLPGAIVKLINLGPDRKTELPSYLPGSGPASTDYLQGMGALQTGDFTGAVGALGRVTAAAPDFGMGWCALGWAQWKEYAGTGREELLAEALDSLDRSIAAAPGLWWPLFYLGEIHRRTGNPGPAIAAFQAGNELDPGNPLVCRGLSRVYRGEKRLAEAEAILLTAIERRPDYFEAPRVLALHYYRVEEEEEEAIRLLDRVLTLAPGDSYALNTKGALYVRRGEYKQARVPFERAFALTPNCETCSNIGFVLFFEGKYRESASFYELALEYCGEDDVVTWANWAKALYWTEGGRPESVPIFERAIAMAWEKWERSPGDPKVIGDLIDFHAMIGDEETTRRLIAEADSLAADNGQLLFQIGDAYEILDDRGAALRYLAKAIRQGVPVKQLLESPDLADLITDQRFVRMIAAVSGQEEAQAGSLQ